MLSSLVILYNLRIKTQFNTILPPKPVHFIQQINNMKIKNDLPQWHHYDSVYKLVFELYDIQKAILVAVFFIYFFTFLSFFSIICTILDFSLRGIIDC